VAKLLPLANDAKRTKQPVSELVLATNCGGSDGNSGITANPALGWAVDELVRYGGTSVLAETPEIYGAEHLLIRRAINEGVAKKLIDRYKWWEWYCRGIEAMDNNPAPGNKAGGITTVFEKSLGGVTKGGTTPMMDVFSTASPSPRAASCSWTRRATIRSPSPASWPEAATSSASPRGAAASSAASRCPPSSSPPTP
jgi:altronate hydrolase